MKELKEYDKDALSAVSDPVLNVAKEAAKAAISKPIEWTREGLLKVLKGVGSLIFNHVPVGAIKTSSTGLPPDKPRGSYHQFPDTNIF